MQVVKIDFCTCLPSLTSNISVDINLGLREPHRTFFQQQVVWTGIASLPMTLRRDFDDYPRLGNVSSPRWPSVKAPQTRYARCYLLAGPNVKLHIDADRKIQYPGQQFYIDQGATSSKCEGHNWTEECKGRTGSIEWEWSSADFYFKLRNELFTISIHHQKESQTAMEK